MVDFLAQQIGFFHQLGIIYIATVWPDDLLIVGAERLADERIECSPNAGEQAVFDGLWLLVVLWCGYDCHRAEYADGGGGGSNLR